MENFLLLPSAPAAELGRAKTRPVFRRNEERLDHLGATEVAPKLVELMQPEVVAIEIGVGWFVWVPLQIAKVLHRHKGRIELALREGFVLGDVTQGASAGLSWEILRVTFTWLGTLLTLFADTTVSTGHPSKIKQRIAFVFHSHPVNISVSHSARTELVHKTLDHLWSKYKTFSMLWSKINLEVYTRQGGRPSGALKIRQVAQPQSKKRSLPREFRRSGSPHSWVIQWQTEPRYPKRPGKTWGWRLRGSIGPMIR